MKKFGIIALAALLVVAFTMPAAALENTFGGYWRTRAVIQQNFTGEDQTEAQDQSLVDTRTRIYYTAKLNDNLKLVNKFEWNVTWGDTVGGDIGADGTGILRIKNSYADFNLGAWNVKVGIQGTSLGRNFLFADDFSGVIANYKGDGFNIPLYWIKYTEGGKGMDANDFDVDMVAVNPKFKFGDGMSIQPFVLYMFSDDASSSKYSDLNSYNDTSLYWVGFNLDAKFDAASLWFTGAYQGGSQEITGGTDYDVAAYLAAVGGNMALGAADVHGQIFYATGDDNTADSDLEAFIPPPGRSYYWSEIMGWGIFDQQESANSPADGISNILAANLGVTFKPMDKLKLTADLWYAALAEDDSNGNDDLGTEIDLKATYQLVENLNLDVVGAMLIAGDATYPGSDDANPWELGARLSLSF